MKFSLPAFCLLCLAGFSVARAQEGRNPADEIITDFGIDEYLAVPQWTLSIGAQSLSGAKASFSGHGLVSSFQPPSDITTPNILRTYHDGTVYPDASPVTFTYSNSDGTTTTYVGPITPAGQTNNWAFLSSRMVREDGNLDFHSYTATVDNPGTLQPDVPRGYGIEINLERDLGKLTKNIEWKLVFGGSLNDIKAHTSTLLNSTVTTIADTYYVNLNGQTMPVAPPAYSAPHTIQVGRVDADGNPVLDGKGNQYIDYQDASVLLGNVPLGRTTTVINNGIVAGDWLLKGAYFSFRAGPKFCYRITDRLRFTLGAGLALIYAGTQYTVVQVYIPQDADSVFALADEDESKLLVGYYVDATLQYDFTDRAGFYAGAVYQTGDSYTETASLSDRNGSTGAYKALVDLSSLQGFRMGMCFKF